MDNFLDDRLPDSYAICLLGHGSRDPEGLQEFLILSKKLSKRKFCRITECGFLGFANPTIPEALSACQRDGIENIIIVPSILLPGEHTQRDIPNAIGKIFQDRSDINIYYAEPLGTQTEVMEVCRVRIEEAEDFSKKNISSHETMLMTIVHGSHDTDCNIQVEKQFHLFSKKMGFAKAITHFAGTSQNSLEESLGKSMPQEFHRVILLPFFLFTGVWVKRVHALADTFQEKHPNTEFLKASCLKHHDLIVDTLIQRARKSISSR